MRWIGKVVRSNMRKFLGTCSEVWKGEVEAVLHLPLFLFLFNLFFIIIFSTLKENSSRTKVCLGKNEEVEAYVYNLKLVMALEAYL